MFKDSVAYDLNHTFFRSDEIAGEHKIDGEAVIAIVQDTDFTNASNSRNGRVNVKETSTNKEAIEVYIREEEVRRLKRGKITANSMINIDGKKMFVVEAKAFSGIVHFTAANYHQ